MSTIYIETSIISYATARLSSDPHVLVRQDDAKRWWVEYSNRYRLFISQAVLDEASKGDDKAAQERLRMIEKLPVIPITDAVINVAKELLVRSLLPEKASVDALHVAAAAVGGVEYLLTLNCRHIANAHMLPKIYQALEEMGVSKPLICTPQEFFGDEG